LEKNALATEQSKAAKRRYYDGAFHSRYFVGQGIDIGGKPDPLGQYAGIFAAMGQVRTWDIEDGDGQYLESIPDNHFDFLHASHSLEHMVDVEVALGNWARVVKPGGYLIITVPDEDMYEMGHWPSRFNSDHKWSFTIYKTASPMPKSINVIDLVKKLGDVLEVERIQSHRDFFREALREREIDQTLTPVAECAIEIIWRKR
jgi:predicted SAM-dependent methyltransferase